MKYTLAFLIVLLFTLSVTAQTFTQNEIIYGRKDGLAMTMVRLTPAANANDKAIIFVVSGNWRSSYAGRPAERLKPFLDKGYTVFEVIHGSQPKYTIAEALSDVQRAVRFIKFNAKEYNIDPDRIGITGASAGGHLSLMIGLMNGEGVESSRDPVNKLSSKVKAVAVFFPPTNFMLWGEIKDPFRNPGILKATNMIATFDFKVWDSAIGNYSSIRDTTVLKRMVSDLSPITHVTPDDPPVFIYHGDKDRVVPLQQSQVLLAAMKEKKVPVELKIKQGADHGWLEMYGELVFFIKWFDKYL